MLGLLSSRITVRSVALVLLLVASPVGPASALRPPVDPLDLLDIELDDVVLPEPSATRWTVVQEGPPLVLKATARPGLAPDRFTMPIADIETMGYEVELTGGALLVLVDGELVRTLTPGVGARDLALATSAQEVVWEFVPGDLGDVVWVTLRGAKPLLAPVLGWFTQTVTSYCGRPEAFLMVSIRYSVPLAAGSAEVRLDDESIGVYARGIGLSYDTRYQYFHMRVPHEPTGTVEALDFRLRDAWGNVWDILLDAPIEHETYADVSHGPNGWVYDLRPALGIGSYCIAHDMSNVRLTVNGLDVTSALERCETGVVYRPDRDLAFNETLAYRFEVTLADGEVVVREGNITEGLDVLELDVPRLALGFHEMYVKVNAREGRTYQVLTELQDPLTLPPVYDEMQVPLVDFAWPIIEDRGARLRILYAPLDVVCERELATCKPYGGGAPGFVDDTVTAATLTITTPDGRERVMPGVGQFAAASRLTVLGQGARDEAEYQAARADALQERLNAEAAYWQAWLARRAPASA